MKSYLADCHVHTSFSDDSQCPMQEMIEHAISLGLDELIFTEHVDYGVKTDLNCDYKSYFQTIELFEKDIEVYPFDFIILSNHQIGNKEFWNYAYQQGKTQKTYQTDYYKAIYEVMKRYKNYSVLGHLDMIKRYDRYGDFPDEKIMNYVDPILELAIEDGKGIEVNTSSFKYGLKDLMPSRTILKRYRELGGKIITIGSDTHETGHLADHIPEVKAELKKLGYEYFCTFEKMQPVYHKL